MKKILLVLVFVSLVAVVTNTLINVRHAQGEVVTSLDWDMAA